MRFNVVDTRLLELGVVIVDLTYRKPRRITISKILRSNRIADVSIWLSSRRLVLVVTSVRSIWIELRNQWCYSRAFHAICVGFRIFGFSAVHAKLLTRRGSGLDIWLCANWIVLVVANVCSNWRFVVIEWSQQSWLSLLAIGFGQHSSRLCIVFKIFRSIGLWYFGIGTNSTRLVNVVARLCPLRRLTVLIIDKSARIFLVTPRRRALGSRAFR